MHVLATKKVGKFRKSVVGIDNELEIIFLERNKDDDDKANIETLRKSIESDNTIKILGHFAKDIFKSKFFQSLKAAMADIKLDVVDISASMASFFAVKDSDELEKIKKASKATAKIFQESLKMRILKVVYSDTEVKHSELTTITEEYIEKNDLEGLDQCYPPIVQSGGTYSLKFSAKSDDSNLHMGVIVCSMGLECDHYCSNIMRTIMFDATAEKRQIYDYLVDDLYVFALENIQPGISFGDVSKAIKTKLARDKPLLVKNLLSSFGFSTGIQFMDRFLIMTSKSSTRFKKDMALIFYIGLKNLECPGANDERTKTYSIWIGDTIIVAGSQTKGKNRVLKIGGNLILTGACKKESKYNLYASKKLSVKKTCKVKVLMK